MRSSDGHEPPDQSRNRSQDSNATASDLIGKAKSNDPEAWKVLFDRYAPLIRYWCRKSGFTADETDEVVQTAMTRVWVYLPRFSKDGEKAAFRRWLRAITLTIIADRLRQNGKNPRAAGGTGAIDLMNAIPDHPPEDGSSDAPSKKERSLVWEIMDYLEDEFQEKTWRAFLMVFLEKRTSTEAAEELGMSPTAVRLAKARVLRRLRDEATKRAGNSDEASEGSGQDSSKG
ncbi:MAG: RNA polymerase sigma factor [Planctomycetaceae bacterium]